jgi:CRISPR/Cas system CSM-associated protein Csm3 (group 7 of RAMP superfamily)
VNDRQITLCLVTRSGLHVGGGEGNSVTDALVRRDASGRPIIPGTSLAGALRALATRLAPRLGFAVCAALRADPAADALTASCGCEVCSLFGDVNPADDQGRASGGDSTAASESQRVRAGRLWAHDARPLDEAGGWVRDGVGIERETGAAYRRGRTKFDVETLRPGVEFDLRLELQCPDGQVDVDLEERLLAAVLSEWVAGRGAVGGRVSRGLGALAIRDGRVTYRKVNLADPATLFQYIAEDDPWRAEAGDEGWLQRRVAEIRHRPFAPAGVEGAARSWAELVAEIQFAGPMLVHDPALAGISGFDHAPFSASGDSGKPTIPGSSLKGVLRSSAERIARTLSTRAVWRDIEPARRAKEFLARCPACDPLVDRLPGAARVSATRSAAMATRSCSRSRHRGVGPALLRGDGRPVPGQKGRVGKLLSVLKLPVVNCGVEVPSMLETVIKRRSDAMHAGLRSPENWNAEAARDVIGQCARAIEAMGERLAKRDAGGTTG